MKTPQVIAAFALALVTGIGQVTASPISYVTVPSSGATAVDSLNPNQWIFWAARLDYWRFYGSAGATVTITGRRLDGDLDPAFYLFRGEFADTDQVAGLIQHNQQIALADDQLPPNLGVPAVGTIKRGDPQLLSFTLPDTGAYTIGFGSYSDGTVVDADGLYEYNLTVSGNLDFPVGYTPDPTYYDLIANGVPEVLPDFLGQSVPDSGTTLGYLTVCLLGLAAFRPLVMAKASRKFYPHPGGH